MGSSSVSIFSVAARYGGKAFSGSTVDGYGNAKSTSDYALDRMSEGLVDAVDRNNERAYRLAR